MPNRTPITILMADDDGDDCLLVKDAFAESGVADDLRFVGDGEELMDFLLHRGIHTDAPRPGLILLDLNMPRKDGRMALEEIKANPEIRSIPVIVFTTSQEQRDILRSYDSGASSYIVKPVTYRALVQLIRSFATYWFDNVTLPRNS